MLVHPRQAWDEIAARRDGAGKTLVSTGFPLATLPAAGWALRLQDLAPAARIESFAMTFAAAMGTFASLAAAIHLIAPAYGVKRRWSHAVAVSVHGSTPVLACGLLFAWPLLTAVGVIAMLHCFYLYYLGLQRVVGCRASDAAEFTAISFLVSMVIAGTIGAMGSGLGWL